jgi:hypothetical protein
MAPVQRGRGLKRSLCIQPSALCYRLGNRGCRCVSSRHANGCEHRSSHLTDGRATLPLDICACSRNMFLVCSHASCRSLQFVLHVHRQGVCILAAAACLVAWSSCVVTIAHAVAEMWWWSKSNSWIQVLGFSRRASCQFRRLRNCTAARSRVDHYSRIEVNASQCAHVKAGIDP